MKIPSWVVCVILFLCPQIKWCSYSGLWGVNKELDLGWKTFSAKHGVQWDVLLCWSLVAQTSACPPPSVADPVCLQESSARKSLSQTLQQVLWVCSLGTSTRLWELESFSELFSVPQVWTGSTTAGDMMIEVLWGGEVTESLTCISGSGCLPPTHALTVTIFPLSS